ncbi:hypothetical protein MPTK1_6g10860 [Marchantia polymorpha subsp. ruderalis]|uniref:Uncharacterized protein n=2 Tax=Marchantia polymorpha TaxID=3197 RepID=A0AAF6BQQ8_MARPO|nr:hypothetical protein MARPO_0016s0125 [Marchantia polymorpha]BBN14342.1 hypothetical protein Mp_6g10860 [Marchantia polymorpha subsp. ruderalis]|eukprot:PTQ45075.1 hypothetical protein MARPO_0016s0125 [Marchantia polymorpha]
MEFMDGPTRTHSPVPLLSSRISPSSLQSQTTMFNLIRMNYHIEPEVLDCHDFDASSKHRGNRLQLQSLVTSSSFQPQQCKPMAAVEEPVSGVKRDKRMCLWFSTVY